MSATITSLMLTFSFAVVGAVCSTGAGAGAACCGGGLLQADRQRTPKPSMPSLIIGIVIDSPYGCLGITRIANTDTSFETSSCQRAKRIHGEERWLFKKEHAFLTTRPPCPMAVAPQL